MSLARPDARRRVALRIALTAVGMVIAAGAWALPDRPSPPSAPAPPAAALPVRGPDPPPLGVEPGGRPTSHPVGVPVRLRIPALHLDTMLDRLARQRDGTLSVPPRWSVPGWYAGGPRPGELGPAVIVGHVDSTDGPAVFFGLSRLRPGDRVEVVQRGGHMLGFVVSDVRRVTKSHFPTALVYGPHPLPVLRLITCTGTFDRSAGSYRDNLVVSAYPG